MTEKESPIGVVSTNAITHQIPGLLVRLTATITPPLHGSQLGQVFLHGPDVTSSMNFERAPHHCSRCVAAGLTGLGHNSGNRVCPSRLP